MKILKNSTYTVSQPRPNKEDFLGLYQTGLVDDGVYVIRSTVDAWCDMKNGGWTVIQQRLDGSENFYRPWNDYVNGFGNRTGEYWIGLENIYQLLLQNSRLRIEMETFGDVLPVRAYAEYTVFKVDSAATNYRLTVGGFSGDCGDALAFHNGMMFTTSDRDNDVSYVNCASFCQSAWWYNNCHHSHLNGLYLRGKYTGEAMGIDWKQCWEHNYSIKTSIMKIKRM